MCTDTILGVEPMMKTTLQLLGKHGGGTVMVIVMMKTWEGSRLSSSKARPYALAALVANHFVRRPG
jgi:hypothetical protein